MGLVYSLRVEGGCRVGIGAGLTGGIGVECEGGGTRQGNGWCWVEVVGLVYSPREDASRWRRWREGGVTV